MKMHRNPSVMKHTFSEVPKAEIPRSTFDRSFGHKTTFDAGYLIPIFLDEAVPGDTFTVRMTGFARLATPIFPIMDNMYMDTHFFSIPLRLLWENWQRFNGEQDDPGDSTDFVIPQIVAPAVTGFAEGSIYDYMGLPPGVPDISVSALFLRAYALCYNQWFRDQNMINSIVIPRDDGPDTAATYALRRRGKRHDYFTSALPWPQKGPGVTIPLGTTATIRTTAGDIVSGAQSAMRWNLNDGTKPGGNNFGIVNAATGAAGVDPTGAPAAAALVYPSNLYADLSTATAATINSLRQAFQIQKIYERDARGGTRYTEIIKAHFGVTSPDARLQRPEYLGGGSTMVNVTPIPQTSSSDATTPQGNLAAMATALASGHGFTASFTEHCIILGLVSVRADLTYQQGVNRMWKRRTRFDFYWPALAHIGEQAVLRGEIFADGTTDDDIVFGYQERFAEMRYKPSMITAEFRSSAAASLDAWHLSQDFVAAPTLSQAFIEEDPPVDRVIAVPDEPHFIFDSFFTMHCARPMPVYGVPGLIDHF